jgi:hypothetical protein
MDINSSFVVNHVSFLKDSEYRLNNSVVDGSINYFHPNYHHVANINIENYRINNCQINGLSFQSNIKREDSFNFSDQQPLIKNIDGSQAVNPWCWAFYKKQEHFFLYSNFKEDSNTNAKYLISVNDKKVCFYSTDKIDGSTTLLGELPLEFVPFITIVLKHTDQVKSGFLPVYTVSWLYWFGRS